MKLQISLLKNDNLLQKFPKDPDYDIVILCKDTQFKLQIAFLYLESKYFDEMEQQNCQKVELHQFDKQPLAKVLMLLYGGEITIRDFQELGDVYPIINFLKIDSLKEIVSEQLREQIPSLNSIELLQFSYAHNILKTEVSNLFFTNDLQILRNPKYSLELSKLSENILSVVLLQYYQKAQANDDAQIDVARMHISGILSDYFHTKKRNPQQYFSKHNVQILKQIWIQYHPGYYSQSMYASGGSLAETRNKEIEELKQRKRVLLQLKAEQQQKMKNLKAQRDHLKEKMLHKEDIKISHFVQQQCPHGNLCDLMNRPPSLPPTLPVRQSQGEDEDYQPKRKIYITQGIKTKQDITKIHTRNSSRNKY